MAGWQADRWRRNAGKIEGAGAVAEGLLPDVSAAIPDVTSAKYGEMRGISEGLSLKGNVSIPGKARTDKKPYAPKGFEWHAQSKGFTCRRIVIEGGKRRRVYVGFLSGKAWADMQAAHKGPELRSAIRQWIEGRRK